MRKSKHETAMRCLNATVWVRGTVAHLTSTTEDFETKAIFRTRNPFLPVLLALLVQHSMVVRSGSW